MSTTKKTDGFSTAERAAMRACPGAEVAGEERPEAGRQRVGRSTPSPRCPMQTARSQNASTHSSPTTRTMSRTWYGMPAHAKPDGKPRLFLRRPRRSSARRCTMLRIRGVQLSTKGRCGLSCS